MRIIMQNIIIPTLIIALLAKAKKSAKSGLSIKGVIEVKHTLTDRIRVSIPSLKNSPEVVKHLIEEVNKIDAVQSITASPVTGSVLISYNQSEIEPVLMLGILVRLLQLDEQIGAKEKSMLEKEFSTISNSFDKSLLTTTKGVVDTKSVVTLFLIAGLAYTVHKNFRSLAMLPTPLTLLWWLYQNNLISKEEK